MRWKHRQSDMERRLGEERICRKFLWYPRRIGDSVWRWLEFADILYKIKANHDGWDVKYKWVVQFFVDKKDEQPS